MSDELISAEPVEEEAVANRSRVGDQLIVSDSADMVTANARPVDRRTSDQRSSDQRSSDERLSDQRSSDQRSSDERLSDQLSTDHGSSDHASRNQALFSYWVLPLIFLTVALLGGLRVNAEDHAFIFLPPPLITLVLAVLLVLLFVRGGLFELRSWIAANHSPFWNVSHIWLLLTLFFASAQAFNSVLPERGLLHWLFSFFFLWTLWNNQFSSFDARRLLRSLVVLFGTAFVLKHMLLASLYAPGGGWLKQLAGALAQGISLDAPAFAPATGYISFFTLGLYIGGLMLVLSTDYTDYTDRQRAEARG